MEVSIQLQQTLSDVRQLLQSQNIQDIEIQKIQHITFDIDKMLSNIQIFQQKNEQQKAVISQKENLEILKKSKEIQSIIKKVKSNNIAGCCSRKLPKNETKSINKKIKEELFSKTKNLKDLIEIIILNYERNNFIEIIGQSCQKNNFEQENYQYINEQYNNDQTQNYDNYQEENQYYEYNNYDYYQPEEQFPNEEKNKESPFKNYYNDYGSVNKSPKKSPTKQQREKEILDEPPIKSFESLRQNDLYTEDIYLSQQHIQLSNKRNDLTLQIENSDNEEQLINNFQLEESENLYANQEHNKYQYASKQDLQIQFRNQYIADWWIYLFGQNNVVSIYEFYLRMSEAINALDKNQPPISWEDLRQALPSNAVLITPCDFQFFFEEQWEKDEQVIIEYCKKGKKLYELQIENENNFEEIRGEIVRENIIVSRNMKYLVFEVEKGLAEENVIKSGEIMSIGVDGYTEPQSQSFFPSNKMVFVFGRLPIISDLENFGIDFRLADRCNSISRNQFGIQVKFSRFTQNETRTQYLFKELSQLGNSYLIIEKKPYALLPNIKIQLGDYVQLKVINISPRKMPHHYSSRFYNLMKFKNLPLIKEPPTPTKQKPLIQLEIISGEIEGYDSSKIIQLESNESEDRDFIIGNGFSMPLPDIICSNDQSILPYHCCISYEKNWGWTIKDIYNSSSSSYICLSEQFIVDEEYISRNPTTFEVEDGMAIKLGDIQNSNESVVLRSSYLPYPDDYESEIDVWRPILKSRRNEENY